MQTETYQNDSQDSCNGFIPTVSETGFNYAGIKKLARIAGSSVPKIKLALHRLGLMTPNGDPTQGALDLSYASFLIAKEKHVEKWGCQKHYPVWSVAAVRLAKEAVEADSKLKVKSTAIGGRLGAISFLEDILKRTCEATHQCTQDCYGGDLKRHFIDVLNSIHKSGTLSPADVLFISHSDQGALATSVAPDFLGHTRVLSDRHCPLGVHLNLLAMHGRFLPEMLEVEGNRKTVIGYIESHRRFILGSSSLAIRPDDKQQVLDALADLTRLEVWARRYAWDRKHNPKYKEGMPKKRKSARPNHLTS